MFKDMSLIGADTVEMTSNMIKGDGLAKDI